MTVELRRGTDRFRTRAEGRDTLHSFSFGSFYDPANLGFAAMVAHNDENLPPGTGYDDHRHADVEIVTWVLDGALRHTDSTGRTTVLEPGEVLRTSAGSGIVHAEVSASAGPTRFLQTWLRPDEPGVVPSFASTAVGTGPDLVEVVGPAGAVDIGAGGARLFVGSPGPGTLVLPEAPRLHVFVVSGDVAVGERALCPGDAARLTDEGGRALTVGSEAVVAVWAFG
ncbi:pirin family protein [Marmoricola sp. RAF53]|uniref:pirin family protein n=1 Tax=Marmoricola sp. RAF53 TaxID=3233059 RepID=UPI003F9A87DD